MKSRITRTIGRSVSDSKVPDVDFDAELEKLQKQNEDMKSRLEQLNENIKAAKEAMGKE